MSDENPMGQVIQIDEARIRDHLGEMVRGTVEETLNAMLDAEADQLCGAGLIASPASHLDVTRTADEAAKEHPEPAVPGHYPADCVAGQHRWVTPVQGYVMAWCAIELRTNVRGNVAATAYVDATVQRGFTENRRLTVRYDFDCVGNFSINLSPPLPITAAGPVSTPYHGRRKLIFAGLSLEVCAAFPPLLPSIKVSMRTSLWTPAARSARPNARWVCYG